MLSHTGTLWQYLGSFVLYTLGAVGLMYGAYWYARRSIVNAAPATPVEAPNAMVLESSLSLEPQKTLYIVRVGEERFLISTTAEGLQFLSKLEKEILLVPEAEIPTVRETPRLEPWYANAGQQVALPVMPRRTETFGSRFIKSVQWLVSSRMK